MIRKLNNKDMGHSNLGWLRSIFHFSFAEYHNMKNMNFGVLRVLNDDLIDPQEGFGMHPHRDMEIISYVIDGELTHEDSMGNKGTLQRGHVQYMSAGTGVFHSEHNLGVETGRILQIWILPDKKGYTPKYGENKFERDLRKNNWFHMVSGQNGDAPIKINQDSNIYALELEESGKIEFELKAGRQAYLVQIEGNSNVNGQLLTEKDAMEITEETIKIEANQGSKTHYLMIEMKKE